MDIFIGSIYSRNKMKQIYDHNVISVSILYDFIHIDAKIEGIDNEFQ